MQLQPYDRNLGLALCVVAATLALTAATAKSAQRGKVPVYRAFDGRPISHTCNAVPGSAEGLKQAMIRHSRSLIGFKSKMRSGAFRVPKNARSGLKRLMPAQILQRISAKLHRIDGSHRVVARTRPIGSSRTTSPLRYARPRIGSTRTAALIYDVGIAAGQYSLCVWLVSAGGLEAAASVALPLLPLAQLVRTSMGVTALAEARMPVRRGRAKRRSRKRTGRNLPNAEPDGKESPFLRVSLAEVASFVLPPDIMEKLIGTQREQLLKTAFNRIVILPAADIGSLPFAALPVGDKRLIDHVAIVLLPDIDALMADEIANPPPFTGRRALIVGDPDLLKDTEWIFQPLPGAKREAFEVGRLTRSPPLLGSSATKQRVMDQLKRRPHLIYFATHGISDTVNPMDQSFLALTGGHLYGRDIKRLRSTFYREFVNPIVIMSACQTGLGKIFEGGVFGLARAWHYAGAWQVIMSLWNVDDKATRALMARFMTNAIGSTHHRRSWSGHGFSGPLFEAWDERMRLVSPRQQGLEFELRAAALSTRKQYQNPALWAGFVHYGLPTMQR